MRRGDHQPLEADRRLIPELRRGPTAVEYERLEAQPGGEGERPEVDLGTGVWGSTEDVHAPVVGGDFVSGRLAEHGNVPLPGGLVDRSAAPGTDTAPFEVHAQRESDPRADPAPV